MSNQDRFQFLPTPLLLAWTAIRTQAAELSTDRGAHQELSEQLLTVLCDAYDAGYREGAARMSIQNAADREVERIWRNAEKAARVAAEQAAQAGPATHAESYTGGLSSLAVNGDHFYDGELIDVTTAKSVWIRDVLYRVRDHWRVDDHVIVKEDRIEHIPRDLEEDECPKMLHRSGMQFLAGSAVSYSNVAGDVVTGELLFDRHRHCWTVNQVWLSSEDITTMRPVDEVSA